MEIVEFKHTIRPTDLALKAGRKRQSPRTGFVHYFPSDDTARDVIPIFENFCFAMALCRQKTAEGVLEAKELIERLLAFQTQSGNFPTFLHDFPRCWDHHLGLKIAPILIHILRDFGAVLPKEFKALVELALQASIQSAKDATHPAWLSRRAACVGQYLPLQKKPHTASEWFDAIINQQLLDPLAHFPIPFNTSLQVFLGAHEAQERGEPQALPIEYLLSEGSELEERLISDHPHQLHSGILLPFTSSKTFDSPFCFISEADQLRLFWKGKTLHSLFVADGLDHPCAEEAMRQRFFDLPAQVDIGRNDVSELSVFANVSSETSIFINGGKGNVFRLGDTVSIQTPGFRIDLQLHLIEGTGDFCGHISRSNRPGQIACKGAALYEAYDWRIALRTLRREGPCKISLSVKVRVCL